MERKSLVPLVGSVCKIVGRTTVAVRGQGKVEDRKGYKSIFSGSQEEALKEAERIATKNASRPTVSIQQGEEEFER